MLIEVCANSVQSAINAEKSGADRIELCHNLQGGGTTPSAATIRLAKELLQIKVVVLIRPRLGDFFYSPLEFEIMIKDIEFCKEFGADGVAVGVLQADGKVDLDRSEKLIQTARPMEVCFHRAFDQVIDPVQSLEELITLDFDRVLTSGGQKSAYAGRQLLKELVMQAKNRIKILAGGGINHSNVLPLVQETGVEEIHFSARKERVADFQSEVLETRYYETDEMLVREIISALGR